MPDNTYPPFVEDLGGRIQPRQLNRWLDVSPQGGALRRTDSYIEIPSFLQSHTWLGYSDIVLAYNFAAPNNFVFSNLAAIPTSLNYVLCIAFQKDGIVYRYKLGGPDGVFLFDLVDYSGQLIRKNFRLEIWSIADADVTQASAVKLYTSVKGHYDFRNSSDFELVDSGAGVEDFSTSTDDVTLPFSTDLLLQFRADLGFDLNSGSGNIATWINQVNALDVLSRTGVTNPAPLISTAINGNKYLSMSSAATMEGATSDVYATDHIFVVFKSPLSSGIAGNVVTLDNGGVHFSVTTGVSASTATMTITGFNSDGNYVAITNKFSNKFYLMELTNRGVTIYDLSTSEYLYGGGTIVGAAFSMSSFTLAEARGIDVAEVIAYKGNHFSTTQDYGPLFKYLSDRYGAGMISVPFVFPTNAVVPNN